jgi:hypothetical protein
MRRPRIKAEGALRRAQGRPDITIRLRFMRILRMSFGATSCMSRVIERRFIFDAHLKDKFLNLMRNLANFGGHDFLEKIFHRYRGHFGGKRKTGSRPLRFADWGGLCALRDLRLRPVTRSS